MPHMAGTRYALGRSGWVVAGLAAVRVVLPLVALGDVAPALVPEFDYDGLTGDATGFYAAVREIVASWADLPPVLVALLAVAVVAASAGLAVAWRRRPSERVWVVVAGTALFALVFCAPIAAMNAPGAGVVGWPLVWSLPLHPWLGLGLALDQDGAYVVAVVLSVAANVVSVVATAYAGLFATGRRSVAVGAAALLAFWPVLTGLVVGDRAWENGTFTVDAGLAAYSEPLSTALVTVALALLLSPSVTDVRLAAIGALLGLAASVKLTNGLLAAAALALVALRFGPRRSLPLALAGASFVPLLAIYWPKGYPAVLDEDPDLWPDDAFSLGNAGSAWGDSLVFTPTLLMLLVPLAVLGAFLVRSWPRRLLVLWALLNPVVYSVYFITPQHPRVLFASLPPVFVLWMLGAATVVDRVLLRRHEDGPVARDDAAIARAREQPVGR